MEEEYDQLEGSLELDLGNLCAFDATPVEEGVSLGSAKAIEKAEKHYRGLATRIFQAMTNALFALPFEMAPVGRIAELPAPTTVLPREKPLPKPRAPTKWEIFAQRKGIQKRKRSNLEWDETNQEWRRRHGYKRVDDEHDIPIMDAGMGEDTGVEDPFTKNMKEKKERVKKQSQRQLANLKNAAKEGGQGALPATLRLAATLPEHGRGKPTKRKEMLAEIKKSSKHVAVSTASMGKHDRVVKGEDMRHRAANKKLVNKKNVSATVDRQVERDSQNKLVDHIIRKNADDILDIGKAIGTFESAAREQGSQHRMKKKGANKKGRLEGLANQKNKRQQPSKNSKNTTKKRR